MADDGSSASRCTMSTTSLPIEIEELAAFTLPVIEVPKYRFLGWFIAWGSFLAAIILLVPIVAALYAVNTGGPWWTMAIGTLVGVVGAFLILVIRDLARVISDMLLPR